MRLIRLFSLVFSILLISVATAAQLPPGDPQAQTLAGRAVRALTNGLSVNDVTLTGTARRIAGSDEETGTVVLRGMAAGHSRMDIKFPSGPRSEVRAKSANGSVGSWSGPDGVSNAISHHNLMTDPTWFFPAFVLARALSGSGYVAIYVGRETRNSVAVEHLTVVQQSGASPEISTMLQHLSRMDIFLDSATFLPVVIAFNTHPDKDAGRDIPVEVRFSDYRTVGGARVPFRVQKYLNNSLVLEFQFGTAALNTGLSASAFNVP